MKKNQSDTLKLPLLVSIPSESDHSQKSNNSPHNNSFRSNENSQSQVEFDVIEIPEKSNLILLSSLLSIELYFLIFLIPNTYLFEYCNTRFYFNYIEQIDTISKEGILKYYYTNTNCEEIIKPTCENICFLAHNIDTHAYLLILSAGTKIFLSSLSCILITIQSIKRQTLHTRKILLACESISLLLSIIGIFSFLQYLSDPTQSNTKSQNTIFSVGPSAYLISAVLIFTLISRVFIFISLNPKKLTNPII
jgi:hypothetical protein